MPTHRIKQWVVKSCIQIKFVNVFLARQKIGLAQNEFGMKKQHIMKCEIKIFIRKAKPIVLLTNALCVDSGAIVLE